MKAIRIDKPGDIGLVEVEKPKIANSREILIRVVCGSICGSDLGIFKGTNSVATYPIVIGHEFGGVVEEIGSEVTGIRPGDLVAVDPVRSCGHCYACRHGRQNVCAGVKCVGVHMPGGFSEFVTVPAERANKVDPERISPELVCLIEPYSIGVQVNTRGRIAKGDLVLVMGCGPAGLCIIQDARARGAVVLASDIIDARLEAALKMGAAAAVNVKKEDIRKAAADFSRGEGMPVVVDAACTVDSFPLALDLASPGGRAVIMGLGAAVSQVPAVAVTRKELDVIGSRLNNHRFEEVIAGMERGIYAPEFLRSHVFPLAEAVKAFDLALNHPEEVRKVVLKFDA
ncbi:MAG: zinc-binding alcohol dehydrogenase family protein [Planctomycetota bacterium]|jgi:L-gulonate 5-dehydrogenase|nr:zinc-binding alcohol dehydrogenase family protein [Planctomycetota bacterium]